MEESLDENVEKESIDKDTAKVSIDEDIAKEINDDEYVLELIYDKILEEILEGRSEVVSLRKISVILIIPTVTPGLIISRIQNMRKMPRLQSKRGRG